MREAGAYQVRPIHGTLLTLRQHRFGAGTAILIHGPLPLLSQGITIFPCGGRSILPEAIASLFPSNFQEERTLSPLTNRQMAVIGI